MPRDVIIDAMDREDQRSQQLPERHQQTAPAYHDRHPDRVTALNQLIDVIR
jgi:hypothetical protein